MEATAQHTSVTNEDIFAAISRLSVKVDGMERQLKDLTDSSNDMLAKVDHRFEKVENELLIIRTKLQSHDVQLAQLGKDMVKLLGEHNAYINDISDVLDRITILEERFPRISEKEIDELQILLQCVAEWAIKAASRVDVPLKLPV